jgi:protein tyrosine/serine phosphatase/S-adenosylmethionine hydrolase
MEAFMKKTTCGIKRVLTLFTVFAVLQAVFAASVKNNLPVSGTVAEIQKYGNLTMDIPPQTLYDAGFKLGDILAVTVKDRTLAVPFCTSYSDVDTGTPLVRDDKKNNLVVVAINMGNFAKTYGVSAGDTVSFSLKEKAGYLSACLLHQLKRTNERSDYSLDSVFANFRSISVTGIKPGVIYRSSSPVNNEIGRAAYADKLTAAVGIQTVVNLADSAGEIERYASAQAFDSPYYYGLFKKGQVKPLNMGVDFSSPDFQQKLAEGLRFIIKNNGPYLIHCTEGKDRAGFVSAVLECFMGAGIDEVKADYMTTYKNYYGVEPGTEQYAAIADSNILASVTTVICGRKKGSDISDVNLAAAAKKYLLSIGLSEDEIAGLRAKLSGRANLKTPNVAGKITGIEKYGHTTTDIAITAFNKLGFHIGDMVTVLYGNGFVVEAPYLDGYYVDKGAPLVRAYPGHEDIAVCINYGKIYKVADVKVGDGLSVMLSDAGAYKTEYEVRNLKRTNNRSDYKSDEEFANFRNIAFGSVAPGMLYRTSSPVNNELGRAASADRLLRKAGVKTVVNLADSEEKLSEYTKQADFNSPYYANLIKSGHVIALNMGLAYDSDEFRANIIKGLKFMAENDGPYAFHCTEGKDRAGFMAALLEGLTGASLDDIKNDYMISYRNYYGVTKGTDKYNLIVKDVVGMVQSMAGTKNLDGVDLQTAFRNYLTAGGMSTETIDLLISKLSS